VAYPVSVEPTATDLAARSVPVQRPAHRRTASPTTTVVQLPIRFVRHDSPEVGDADIHDISALRRPEPTRSSRSEGRAAVVGSTEFERHERVRSLLSEMIDCSDPVQRKALQSKVVLEHQGVAKSIAARYRGRGVERGDLEQLAYLGLVKAVMRWQPGRSEDFLQFAVPTIAGEIKRYFRDHSFMVRPPRRLQEVRAALNTVAEDDHGRPADHRSDNDLGEELGVGADVIRQARQAGELCHPRSLDAPGVTGQSLGDSWGADDEELQHVVDRLAVERMMAGLTEREQAVVQMRFADGMSQARIGEVIGVSQMQVSRLLRGIVCKLRTALAER
jgi:RNA polymerase sigma-B factor